MGLNPAGGAPAGGNGRGDPSLTGGKRPSRGGGEADGSAEAAARPGLPARLVAAKLLSAVVDAGTSLDGLTDPAGGHPGFRRLEGRDQGLVRAILVSALRFRGSIGATIDACLDRPLPGNAASLRHILHVGAAQILHLDVPDSAAVDLAVAAASGDPRSARFAPLVNAVLRRLSREKAAGREHPADSRLDCPDWLFARLCEQYGEARARGIAAVHCHPAPLDLTARGDPRSLAEELGGVVVLGRTVRLSAFDGPVKELPGFAEGRWWVQDAAAALPATLLGDVANRRVADLCAAPGGKTAQLAAAGAFVTAVDISASRMKRLRENLGRLGLEAETLFADLADLAPDAPFEAILLDAPCSSTGTMRRHPDVGYTKNPAVIAKLANVQLRLLTDAARLLAPGGRLVFSNCSLDRAEGESVVDAFLAARPDILPDPIRPAEMPGLEDAVTAQGHLRTTPDMLDLGAPRRSGLDGFFAARFRAP